MNIEAYYICINGKVVSLHPSLVDVEQILKYMFEGVSHSLGANLFPQFSWYLGNKRNQIKKTQREIQRSDRCQERGELRKLSIPLSAGVGVRLLTFICRREQQRNFCKSSKKEGTALCQRGGSFRKAENVTVNVKCCSEVQ